MNEATGTGSGFRAVASSTKGCGWEGGVVEERRGRGNKTRMMDVAFWCGGVVIKGQVKPSEGAPELVGCLGSELFSVLIFRC